MATAEAAVDLADSGEFSRELGWRDGFAFALSIPVGGFALIGYSVGILGAWTAMTLWGVSCLVAIMQNFVYAEMAAMFEPTPATPEEARAMRGDPAASLVLADGD